MEKKDDSSGTKVSTRGMRRLILSIGLSLLILLVIAYLAIGAIAANQLTKPKRVFNPDLNPGMYGLRYEEVRYPARNDGAQIAAWYIPTGENEKAIILVHGRDNSRSNGFCDGFVPFANELHNAGFSVLMIDLRGHGQSIDSRFYFGIKEYQDILGAVDWLTTRGYLPGTIGVLGYSLGAASVIDAAAEEKAIGAIWIDISYADIKSVIEGSWVSESGLPQVFFYSADLMARILFGLDITASRPIDEIGKITPRPIFIAHCAEDNLIPISHMEQLLSAAQNSQIWIITNCDQHSQGLDLVPENLNHHAIGYSLQPEVYTQKVIEFFSKSLD